MAGSFQFEFGKFRVFGFWAFRVCHSIVSYNDFGVAQLCVKLLTQEFLGFEALESAIELFHIVILDVPSYASNCYASNCSEFQNYLLRCEFGNPRLSEFLWVLGIVGLTFKCFPSWFLDSLRLILFPPEFNYGRKIVGTRHWNWTFFFSHFRQLTMSDLTLVCVSEFENFLSVERDWNSGISHKVPKSGTKSFLKKMVFPPKLYDFCQCRNFFHIMDCSQTYSKFFQGKFVELSNLRRKFALPTNFDSWFT